MELHPAEPSEKTATTITVMRMAAGGKPDASQSFRTSGGNASGRLPACESSLVSIILASVVYVSTRSAALLTVSPHNRLEEALRGPRSNAKG